MSELIVTQHGNDAGAVLSTQHTNHVGSIILHPQTDEDIQARLTDLAQVTD